MSSSVKATINDTFNYVASSLKLSNPINDITITSNQKNVILCITSSPEIFYKHKEIVKLSDSDNTTENTVKISDVELVYNSDFFIDEDFDNLTEKTTTIRVAVYETDEMDHVAAETEKKVAIQNIYCWDSLCKESLPAFLQPNDESIMRIRKRASEIAEEHGILMCGLQTSSYFERLKQVECIFNAIKELNIILNKNDSDNSRFYDINLPQNIACDTAGDVSSLDLALLFSSVIFEYFNPVIFFRNNKIYSGFWFDSSNNDEILFSGKNLKDSVINSYVVNEILNKNESDFDPEYFKGIIPVFSDYLDENTNISFSQAVSDAQKDFSSIDDSDYCINIVAASKSGISPVFSSTKNPICCLNPGTETAINVEFEEINYVACHLGLNKIVSRLKIQSFEKDIFVSIKATPEIFYENKTHSQKSKKNSHTNLYHHIIDDLSLILNDDLYRREFREGHDVSISVEVYSSGNPNTPLTFIQKNVRVQAYRHFNPHFPETLPAFIQPNDDAVGQVKKRAAEIAKSKNISMCGYQDNSLKNRLLQAECIFEALKEQKIHYTNHPVGFEKVGQSIRIPQMLLSPDCKTGTCLDNAVLFASCIEEFLQPCVFIIYGHAFGGFWLTEHPDNSPVVRKIDSTLPFLCSVETFDKILNKEEPNFYPHNRIFIPVECNMFTVDNDTCTFADAVTYAIKDHFTDSRYFKMVDVAAARDKNCAPAFSYTSKPICSCQFDLVPDSHKNSKLEILQQDAMDFSNRNPLISFDCISELSVGNFAKELISGKINDSEFNRIITNSANQAAGSDKILFSFFNKAKYYQTAFGQNITFLVLGTVTWKDNNSGDDAVTSPIYLCPLSVYRNAGGKIVFIPDLNKISLNQVLKEKLYRDFNIDISALPENPGADYFDTVIQLKSILTMSLSAETDANTVYLTQTVVPATSIYRALNDKSLLNNDIVKGILDGQMSWNNTIDTAEDLNIYDVFAYPADSSQRIVIKKARSLRTQLVYGPPGTGKSQTITNIIIDNILHGKKVLFTADKKNARDIISEKIKSINLGEFCLNGDELNSLDDLKNKINTLVDESVNRIPKRYDFTAEKNNYKNLIDTLALYQKVASEKFKYLKNITFGDLETEVDSELDFNSIIKDENLNDVFDYAKEALIFNQNRCNSFPHDAQICKIIADPDFCNINRKINTGFENLKGHTNMIFYLLGLPEHTEVDDSLVAKVNEYCKVLTEVKITGFRFETPEIKLLKEQRKKLYAEEIMTFMDSFAENELKAEIKKLTAKIEECNKIFDGIENCKEYFPLKEVSANRFSVSGYSKEEIETEAKAKEFFTYIDYVKSLNDKYPSNEVTALINHCYIRTAGGDDRLFEAATQFVNEYEAYYNDCYTLSDFLYRYRSAEGCDGFSNDEIIVHASTSSYSKANAEKYSAAYCKLEEMGLKDVCISIENALIHNGNLSFDDIKDQIIGRNSDNISASDNSDTESANTTSAHSEAWKIEDIDLTALTSQCISEEKHLIEIYTKKARETLFKTLPDFANGISQDSSFGTIQSLLKSKGDYKSTLRGIFSKVPDAMLKLFPCVIMSPEEVAECLVGDCQPFDLVIMDEASQLPTYKAIIPISKSKGCIIVGDDKQLVPTSFFKKSAIDDEGNLSNIRTAFDEALVTSMPKSKLRFHYRSKYENLLTFSNIKYYNNSIYTFADVMQDKGLSSIFCNNAVYDRGKTKTNAEEANTIIKQLKLRFNCENDFASKSVGIITSNVEQMKLIESLLAGERRDNNDFSTFIDENVDVVNLETCQGREWDIVYISTVYGIDENGKFVSNLGPITQDGGGNRLNVMLTRSKEETILVTSMKPEYFSDNSHGGNRDFCDLLAFASGDLSLLKSTNSVATSETSNIDIIVKDVKSKLLMQGFTVYENIGNGKFKVELAVKKPGENKYRLGILFDKFDSEMYIRDTEITIPSAMQAKGWKLYRLSTASYLKNPDGILNEIRTMLAE